MAAVAERLVCGMSASAKRYDRAPAQAERVTGRVLDDYVVAAYAKRAVVIAYYFLIVAHLSSPLHGLLFAAIGERIVAGYFSSDLA